MKVNVAPIADIKFSSVSKWTTKNDSREIFTAEHCRCFSFHTDRYKPWAIIDLNSVYKVCEIRIYNRIAWFQENLKSLKLEIGSEENNFEELDNYNKSICGENSDLSIKLNNVNLRYLKLSLMENVYFHLHKIEIFIDIDLSNDSKFKNFKVLNIFDKIQSFLPEAFVLDINNINISNIKLSETSNVFNFFYYILRNDDRFFYIELELNSNFNYLYLNPEFIYFIKNIANNLNSLFLNDCDVYKLRKTINHDDFLFEFLQFYYNTINSIYNFILILKYKIKNNYMVQSLSKKNCTLIIDCDDTDSAGWADKLKGLFSLAYLCDKNNISYKIKFSLPFIGDDLFEKQDLFLEKEESSYLNSYSYSKIKFFTRTGINSAVLSQYILYSRNIFDYIIISTNINELKEYKFFAIYFNKIFKPSNYLSERIKKIKDSFNSKYISISFRFLNILDDFDEVCAIKPLNQNEQVNLMDKCKKELIEFSKSINSNLKILVFSDSRKFLNYIKYLNNIIITDGDIVHIANIKNLSNVSGFLKTIEDFYLIMGAEKIYRFETKGLIQSGFPVVAAYCAGKPFLVHKF